MKGAQNTLKRFFSNRFTFVWFMLLLMINHKVQAQDLHIQLGNTQIALNEAFTITITLQNENIRRYTNFPDIKGFQKRGTSSSSNTSFINGKMSMSTAITQTYVPLKEGKYNLPAFKMQVNEKEATHPGASLKVGPAKQQAAQDPFGTDPFGMDPFEEFFGGGRNTPREYIEVADDAFFAITTNKNKVYVGEGFTMTIAFYISKSNKAGMDFPNDLGEQLEKILKKVKPDNCWEENFNIREIQPEEVEIDGKRFTEFKLYRATFYPLNEKTVFIPKAGLKMIKYKVAKNPSFFSANNAKADIKEFFSTPKTIKVMALPEHPLKDQVSVGQYSLEEIASKKSVGVGKSCNYTFTIKGEGNISAIQAPVVNEHKNLEIYPPNSKQSIQRAAGRVTGSKNFNYFIIPKEAGKYAMRNSFVWIYFNPVKAKYDTLKPNFVLQVSGEKLVNASGEATSEEDFFFGMENLNNDFYKVELMNSIRYIANFILLLFILLTLIILFRR